MSPCHIAKVAPKMIDSDLQQYLSDLDITNRAISLNSFVSHSISEGIEKACVLEDVYQKFPELLFAEIDLSGLISLLPDTFQTAEIDLFELMEKRIPSTLIDSDRVFTVIASDGYLEITKGLHVVNREGYIIIEKPFYLDCTFC